MEEYEKDTSHLRSILLNNVIKTHGVNIYTLKDTIELLRIIHRYRLQLLEIDAIILHSDGKVQPDSTYNFIIYNNDIPKIIDVIESLESTYHFEFLDADELISSSM